MVFRTYCNIVLLNDQGWVRGGGGGGEGAQTHHHTLHTEVTPVPFPLHSGTRYALEIRSRMCGGALETFLSQRKRRFRKARLLRSNSPSKTEKPTHLSSPFVLSPLTLLVARLPLSKHQRQSQCRILLFQLRIPSSPSELCR